MTETIYKLFESNEFGWKKGVMGCALSHLDLWKRIVQDGQDGFYLVLEDDVRFKPDWWNQQSHYAKTIPEDADLLYLGGVLPPNRPALSSALHPKTSHWSEIKWNTLFTPQPAPIFHFCTYSYAIHRRGAIKLLRYLMESTKRFTVPVDHFLMNPFIGLQKYVANDLPAYCFQDNDPSYVQSDFNNLQRKDVFDSDICNNTECFQEEDLARFLLQHHSPKTESDRMILYQMVESEDAPLELYERVWLEDMFQKKIECRPLVSITDATDLPHDAWYMVQRPHSQKWNKWFHHLQRKGTPFRILHLSDEFVSDMIGCYTLPCCKAVVRNYIRPDTPLLPHIKTIPLGYHHKASTVTPFSNRKWVWSFHGTDWFGRREQVEPFRIFQPNDCRFQATWNDPSGSNQQEYLSSLSDSKYCPIMAGNNQETFRLYEALEAGTLPVTTIKDKEYLEWIEKEMGLSALYHWNDPMKVWTENLGSDAIQQKVRQRWLEWKKRIQTAIQPLTVGHAS
jgi:GR25 family glycosyltransferase involved in LPS biosynthesis